LLAKPTHKVFPSCRFFHSRPINRYWWTIDESDGPASATVAYTVPTMYACRPYCWRVYLIQITWTHIYLYTVRTAEGDMHGDLIIKSNKYQVNNRIYIHKQSNKRMKTKTGVAKSHNISMARSGAGCSVKGSWNRL